MKVNFEKKIVICADDFGISPGVSKGILKLAEKNKISATSVMVCYEDWKNEGKQLIKLKDKIDIGLHFTLTGAIPISSPKEIPSLVNPKGELENLGEFIKKCIFKNIKSEDIKREFFKQIHMFMDFFGFTPHFIDGHHNVHQFPSVKEVLLVSFKEILNNNKFYCRNTSVPLKKAFNQGIDFFKILPITFWGTPYKNLLELNKFKTNSSFMGIYDWKTPKLFGQSFKNFLWMSSIENGIIMTHPGLPDDLLKKRDAFNAGREIEYNFLNKVELDNIFESVTITPSKFNY